MGVGIADCGVVYIVYGKRAWYEARESIKTMRRHHPGLPVAVIGKCSIKGTKHIYSEQRDDGGRWQKVNLDNLSPFDYTLYLDADTRIYGDLSCGFRALAEGWDIVITPSANQEHDFLWHLSETERLATIGKVGRYVLQLQGGLFYFQKSEAVKNFFEAWRAEWGEYRGYDQGALLRALYRKPVRVWLLGRPFNGGAVVGHRFGRARAG